MTYDPLSFMAGMTVCAAFEYFIRSMTLKKGRVTAFLTSGLLIAVVMWWGL